MRALMHAAAIEQDSEPAQRNFYLRLFAARAVAAWVSF
jgi:hypothetical protein